MQKFQVDGGRAFDFGKTAQDYGAYRDIYPQALYDRLYALGVGAPGSAWLDLGTGSGVLPRALARYGAQIVAVDISPEQIEEAKKRSRAYPNITYQVCPAEEVAFPPGRFDVITACQCFWYFDPAIIVPKIRALLRPGGLFVKIYMGYSEDDPIARRSSALVKQLNPSWTSGAAAEQDLQVHYFPHPHEEHVSLALSFTRETWHGRMRTCRGVAASMDAPTLAKFDEMHRQMLSTCPEQFTIQHAVDLVYYYIPEK